MSKEKQKKITIWTMFLKVFPQVVAVSPMLFVTNYIFFTMNGILFAASTLCMQLLFDEVTYVSINGGAIKGAVIAVLVLFLVKISEELTSGIANFIGETYDPKSIGQLTHAVNLKISKLDPICFEDTDILESINKSYTGIRFAVNFINTIMDTMLFYIPYFIFMTLYFLNLKPSLAIVIFFVFFPVLCSQLLKVKLFSKLEDDSEPIRRRAKYYEDCLTGREYLKETRKLGACPYFVRLFKESLVLLNNKIWEVEVKTTLIELATRCISLLGYLGILLILFNALMKKEITVGAFAAVFASIDSMMSMMEEIICGRLGYYVKNFGKIENYLRLLELKEISESEAGSDDNEKGDIILNGVSFSYPGSTSKAIDNISLNINKGETIAIVGENGSGKSTLIRLIIGLYMPHGGKISYDGKDISEIRRTNLYRGTSAVFQKFQRYKMCLKNNITISEAKLEMKTDKYLESVVKEAGINVDLESFPEGYDTMLSREFDGVDLSGGQWQRIAIARGFYRKHEVIVLDEPTAAIDPIEETKIYEQFARASKDSTSIVVTHRLGSVKFVDRIVVMKAGKIVSVGSHEKLLSGCPIYEEMWESQAKYYVN